MRQRQCPLGSPLTQHNRRNLRVGDDRCVERNSQRSDVDVAFGIDNLFDKKAPFIQSWTDGNTDTMTYDLLGRRGYVRLTYQFN